MQGQRTGADEGAWPVSLHRCTIANKQFDLPSPSPSFTLLSLTHTRSISHMHSSSLSLQAVAAARAIENVSHDGIILNVSKCEMTAARTLEQAGEGGGSLPVILTTAQVQYIHTVRNAKVRNHGRCSSCPLSLSPARFEARKNTLCCFHSIGLPYQLGRLRVHDPKRQQMQSRPGNSAR